VRCSKKVYLIHSAAIEPSWLRLLARPAESEHHGTLGRAVRHAGHSKMTKMTMAQAIESARELKEIVTTQGDAAAYSRLEAAIRAYEAEGYPIEAIIPAGAETGLGFSLRRADGRTFFEIYSALLRKRLCTRNGQFSKLVKAGLHTSVGAVLTEIVNTLGIPPVALGIMIPIAVVIVQTGVDAFCEFTEPED
jgi:hypothetical protein